MNKENLKKKYFIKLILESAIDRWKDRVKID